VTKSEIQAIIKESYSLAAEKTKRDKKPLDIFGLSDGIRLVFFAMSSKLATADFLELHDEINRLHFESIKGIGI
jgi:hypothetical protein